MLDLAMILGTGGLAIGFILWCRAGLDLYFAAIKDADDE